MCVECDVVERAEEEGVGGWGAQRMGGGRGGEGRGETGRERVRERTRREREAEKKGEVTWRCHSNCLGFG